MRRKNLPGRYSAEVIARYQALKKGRAYTKLLGYEAFLLSLMQGKTALPIAEPAEQMSLEAFVDALQFYDGERQALTEYLTQTGKDTATYVRTGSTG